MIGIPRTGGEGGIRTLDTGVSPYNGLANRRLQPLGHLSGGFHYSLTCTKALLSSHYRHHCAGRIPKSSFISKVIRGRFSCAFRVPSSHYALS